MANYPAAVLVPRNYADKGSSEDEDLVIDSNNKITLFHYAQGRTILTTGQTLSSSISVRYGSQSLTEIFGSPVPSGNYFYHYTDPVADTSILLISPSFAPGITLNVTYAAAGDIAHGSRWTQIETDLSAVEAALGAGLPGTGTGLLAFQSGKITGTGVISIIAAVPATITSIICLFSAEDGTPVIFNVASDKTSVTVTSGPAGTLHYLFILKQ